MTALDVLAAIVTGALVGAVCFDLVSVLRGRQARIRSTRPDREDPR